MQRRQLLQTLSAALGFAAFDAQTQTWQALFPSTAETTGANGLSFTPIRGAMPLATDGIDPKEQTRAYANYAAPDEVTLPPGFRYEILGTWGDPVGSSRFGYNNDYLSLVEVGDGRAYLTMNFEYVSAVPWMQTFEQVIGRRLPIAEIEEEIKLFTASKGGNTGSSGAPRSNMPEGAPVNAGFNAFALPDSDPLKAKIRALCIEALIDQGMGVIALRRDASGRWRRDLSEQAKRAKHDRRMSGIAGLADGHYFKCTGPARAVFRKATGQGYRDGLGDRIIGTFANCAGGTTPWGTALSGEENFQSQVAESIYPDGTPFDPSERPFAVGQEELLGQGNVLGLAGHKYGWIVEVNPADPNDYGTKHTWLGRYRHEAVGIRAVAGKPLAFYSGCDRRGGHLYKFISRDRVKDPRSKANSKLLAHGMLYAARFAPNGTGRWIALRAETPVDPVLPSETVGGGVLLPRRPAGGFYRIEKDEQAAEFKARFKTLGDLYTGNAEERQGAILIDAHYAATAAGASCTARPEDTEVAADGSLYIAFTSGWPGAEGGPDKRIFAGPKGVAPHEYGFVMRLREDGDDPAALTFRWEMIAVGGEVADGGGGFANPDNLMIDGKGNLWVVTDTSSNQLNEAIPQRQDKQGKPLNQAALKGLFGNNAMWFIPTSGPNAGRAFLFALGPVECEMTGPFLSRDQKTLFLAIQHPGETNGRRRDGKAETRPMQMKTADGRAFTQTRTVPIGSNWPGGKPNDPPKPSVIVITREDGKEIA